MRILLTNDDGIYAPGLRALLPELRKLGEVTVVAPATEQSAVGHSVTLTNPLIVQEVLDDDRQPLGWAVEGRPADCVKLALRELLPEPPDLIVSGLNAGSNAGINVLYSGTVAAAIEGAFFRVTSIACSLEYTQADAARLRPRRRPAPGKSSSRSSPSGPAAGHAVQRQHSRPGKGPVARRPHRAAERRAVYRRLTTAAPTRAAGSTSGRIPSSAVPTRTPTPT